MQTDYLKYKQIKAMPRLPLEGSLDLTYRCNYNCRHCWLRISPSSKETDNELSYNEIKDIVGAARKMGCHKWAISGGEPMLRPDFLEIFDYITSNSHRYSLNTNGALITPKIAHILRRKGAKMVALYGTTAEVYDRITRVPGSFEATMRGFSYLKEAGAGFIVQIVPMRDNYHQFQDMIVLAESLSKHYRIGASWLYLSSGGNKKANKEIARQRLSPKEVIKFNKPELSYNETIADNESEVAFCRASRNSCLLANCISEKNEFHIDPYGYMTFCCFIKDQSLRYALRKGTFEDCWERFIPSLANKIKINQEYSDNCGSCDLRSECSWCPVYGYLEHRRFSAKVDYLCAIAKETKKFNGNWAANHRRYYQIGGLSIQVDSDLPIKDTTFHHKFKKFEKYGPGEDPIFIRHHFALPDLSNKDLGKEVYRKPPWMVYKKNDSWIYLGIAPATEDTRLWRVAVSNYEHTRVKIYNAEEKDYLAGGLHSLTLFPTDQIILTRILADRQGCYMHSLGVIFQDKGLLFAGHSGAGKSTLANMLKGQAEILCDDRIIVRRHPEGFKLYGTWSHGDIPDVSPNYASLKAILFLEKSQDNYFVRITDKKDIVKRILSCLVRPFITADWWEKTLSLVDKISDEVPCYILNFNKSGAVVNILNQL